MVLEVLPGAYYTLREACEFLRISEATARRWLRQGRLPARKLGRDYRLSGTDLLGLLNEQTQQELSLRAFTPDSALLKLAGIGDSGLEDVSEEHDRYLAEAVLEEH